MTETLSPALPPALERAVHDVLERASDRGWSIVAAESCTGGMLASLLTDVEGRSGAFERGFVTYSEQAKCDLLHIAREMIDRCGAVSREVAEAMANGALAASAGNVAVSITGFAGPAGDDDEPGLVHFACAVRDAPTRHRVEHFGNIGRGPTRLAAIVVALEMLEEAMA